MIRKAQITDAEAITRIYNYYIAKTAITFETEEVSVEEMARRISDISAVGPYFVYEDEGQILGYCYAHPWKQRAAYAATFETTVYLNPEKKECGIGTALMQQLIDDCRNRGVHVLIACITEGNEASFSFHRKLGFTPVSRFKEVGRKFNKWLDVIDYERIL